ncbi:MAG: Asp-tRNA(Asn)/Glu-tRNA(Gln) amidotransferase subunit GatB [Candidatus Aenigmatarchaeota archaeon]
MKMLDLENPEKPKVKIGLETHVQLNTQSKMFCGCRNPVNLSEEPEPNTVTCETCLGLPGSKPRANEAVVHSAIKVALALNCRIAKETYFSRKTYFYPDMSKNFQISQYEIPLATGGWMDISLDGKVKRIRLKRLHMEEDPAKLIHIGGIGGKYVLVDYNRSGIPLIEIVTEPDFESPEEARAFLNKLSMVLEYLGVYDSNSKAVFKSDANISIKGGERVEIKNITGTKEIENALKYEIIRQSNLLKKGEAVSQSTRMWNPEIQATQALREKETEEDYGYIFEPDLTSIEIANEWIGKAKAQIPELPDQKYQRFLEKYEISEKLAESLVSELDIANLFEEVAKKIQPKLAASWIAGYLKKTLNYNGIRWKDSGLKEGWIVSLLKMFESGELTDRNAELVIRKVVEDRLPPEVVMERHKIPRKVLGVSDEIEQKIMSVLEKNKKAVNDYKSGEEKALHFLIGLCIKETGGSVDAQEIRKVILKIVGK